jgi:hypothetical protein
MRKYKGHNMMLEPRQDVWHVQPYSDSRHQYAVHAENITVNNVTNVTNVTQVRQDGWRNGGFWGSKKHKRNGRRKSGHWKRNGHDRKPKLWKHVMSFGMLDNDVAGRMSDEVQLREDANVVKHAASGLCGCVGDVCKGLFQAVTAFF